MIAKTKNSSAYSILEAGIPKPLYRALTSLPLFFLQPLLYLIVRRIVRKRPEIFNRIGPHQDKIFLIDPDNMPFIFLLRPSSSHPQLRAERRSEQHMYDSRITGRFMTLFDMVDGNLDGDALFFTRELKVEGDTEAVVCLRNALDDLDGSIGDDIANMFGLPGRKALESLRRIRIYKHEK